MLKDSFESWTFEKIKLENKYEEVIKRGQESLFKKMTHQKVAMHAMKE